RDRIQLPFREAVDHTRPLEAEPATEAAAVGDVRDVDDLVARQLEYTPRLAFQPELAQRLARIVVGDLQAHPVRVDELRIRLQQLQYKTGRVAHAGPDALLGGGTPVGRVHREGAEARRGWGHDQTLGISEAGGELGGEVRPGLEVPGIGRDQPAAPLLLRKTNLEARGGCDLFQRRRRRGPDPIGQARGEDGERFSVDLALADPVAV